MSTLHVTKCCDWLFLILIAGSAVYILVTSAGLFGPISVRHRISYTVKWLIVTAGLGVHWYCVELAQGLFEANAIQFGMDQILEASSDQLSSFIQWYYWSFSLGRLAIYYNGAAWLFIIVNVKFTSTCQKPTKSYNRGYRLCKSTILVCLVLAVIQGVAAIVGLLLLVCNKKHGEI